MKLFRGIVARTRRWISDWSDASTNRKIFSAAVVVGVGTLLVKAAAMARELVVAYHFGTADALDAFYIAYVVPSFVVNVVAGGIHASFVPTYVEVQKTRGERRAQQLFDGMVLASGVLVVVIALLLAASGPLFLPLLGSGFSEAKLQLTQSLFWLLVPLVVLKSLAILWAATLNAEDRYALPAIAPIMVPIAVIVGLTIARQYFGVFALAGGFVIGTALEAAVVAVGISRGARSLRLRWHGFSDELRQVLRQFAPMVVGTLLMSGTDLVDQSMAAALGSGSVSALNYGKRVTGAVVALGSTAIGTAILPHFSRMVADADWTKIRHTFRRYAQLILVVAVPLAAGLIYFSDPLIRLLFERGAFEASDTRLVSYVQQLYLLQVPTYVLAIMCARLMSSLKANRVLMWSSALSLGLNVFLNWLFMRWIGVAGIALSTAAVYLCVLVFLVVMLRKLLREKRADDGV